MFVRIRQLLTNKCNTLQRKWNRLLTTGKYKDTSEPTPTLFQLYKKLGERNRAAKTVVERLAEKGSVVALNTVDLFLN